MVKASNTRVHICIFKVTSIPRAGTTADPRETKILRTECRWNRPVMMVLLVLQDNYGRLPLQQQQRVDGTENVTVPCR